MSIHEITLTVNNEEEELTVEFQALLVHALRNRLGYNGCEISKFGACMVALDGDAVKTCTVLAVQADGSWVTTVDGMADDDLDLIQGSFNGGYVLQCAYCTPGMVMTTRELFDDRGPSARKIRHRLKRNISRCTGYQNVVNAVERVADEVSDRELVADSESPPAKVDGGETSRLEAGKR